MHGIKTEPLRPTIYVHLFPSLSSSLPLSAFPLSSSPSPSATLTLCCIRMECAAGICPLPCTIYSISMGAVWGSSLKCVCVRNAEWGVGKLGLHDNKHCLLLVAWNLINCKLNLTINIEAYIGRTREGEREWGRAVERIFSTSNIKWSCIQSRSTRTKCLILYYSFKWESCECKLIDFISFHSSLFQCKLNSWTHFLVVQCSGILKLHSPLLCYATYLSSSSTAAVPAVAAIDTDCAASWETDLTEGGGALSAAVHIVSQATSCTIRATNKFIV